MAQVRHQTSLILECLKTKCHYVNNTPNYFVRIISDYQLISVCSSHKAIIASKDIVGIFLETFIYAYLEFEIEKTLEKIKKSSFCAFLKNSRCKINWLIIL